MASAKNPISERLDAWASHLESCAAPAASASGVRTDRAFLLWRAACGAGGLDAIPEPESTELDERLWAWLADANGGDELDEILSEIEPEPDGPIRDQGASKTIEVWTESELSLLQALAWAAHKSSRPELFDRIRRACLWHIERTQPDNATNRPWGVHLFAVMAEAEGSGDARLYAETLLHNCMVSSGTPDPLSAEILRDASRALREIDWSPFASR